MKYRYVFYVLALLPVFIFRDYTPNNELKYISIVEEALRDGTWFTFHNHGEIYADKPPLYFWLMMLSRLITGGYHMWLMGLFSLIPAAGIMMVMDRWTRLENMRINPLISNAMLGTTAIFLGAALVLRMDMLMTFFIVLTLYTFFKRYKGRDKPRDKWLLPVWLFLAIFSKGPMGIIIPLVSVASFLLIRREIRNAGRYFGWRQWLILIGLCGLWFGAVYLEGGMEYLNNILFKQTVGRGIDSFHHKQHLFYYLPRMFFTFAPWSLMYLVTIWLGVRRHLFQTDTEKFFFTIVWTNIVMLSLVSSKIDIYMLPIYPFVVYLASAMLSRTGGGKAVKITVLIPSVALMLLWPVSFLVTDLIPFEYDDLTVARLGLAFASVGGLIAVYALYRNKIGQAIWYGATGMLAMLFVAGFSLPQFNREIGLEALAAEAQQTALQNGAESYAYFKYRAFSDMDVFLGEQIARIETIEELDTLDASEAKTVVFIRQRDVRRNEQMQQWIEGRSVAGSIHELYYWIVIGNDDIMQTGSANPAEEQP